jgi:hypothetical protein
MKSSNVLIDGRMATLRSTATTGLGEAIDTTQDGLLADLKFGLEFRQKYAANNNLVGQNQHFWASSETPLSSSTGLDTVAFSGSSSNYLKRTANSNNQFGAKDWSLAFLMLWKPRTFTGYIANYLCVRDQYLGGRREVDLLVQQEDASTIRLGFSHGTGSGSTPINQYISGNLSTNTWYLGILNHTVATKTLDCYLNNSLFGTTIYSGNLGTNSDPLYIGERWNGTSFDGYPSTTSWQYAYKWDRILISPERDWLYNSGSYRFLSK